MKLNQKQFYEISNSIDVIEVYRDDIDYTRRYTVHKYNKEYYEYENKFCVIVFSLYANIYYDVENSQEFSEEKRDFNLILKEVKKDTGSDFDVIELTDKQYNILYKKLINSIDLI